MPLLQGAASNSLIIISYVEVVLICTYVGEHNYVGKCIAGINHNISVTFGNFTKNKSDH